MDPGTRLGAYEILSLLGVGGMGEVYRARDCRLGRDVAVKILPDSFTHDRERVARFRREAQMLAALNHPHIAALYGLEEVNGTLFLVLELVDGENLHQRIARGPMPLEEALAVAMQLADAVDAAHRNGILHRDLKPANIALTCEGTVKVLDFGLAKPAAQRLDVSRDTVDSPATITAPMAISGVGVILGTAAYISPEQAKGKPADARSDVWAFGCVLYEMLAGRRAFQRETTNDTLAAVLTAEPDLTAIPAQVRRLVSACLQKDPKRRLQAIADARLLLDDATGTAQPGIRPARAVAAAAVVVAAAVTFGWWWTWRPAPASPPLTRWTVNLPQYAHDPWLALSPDGSHLAYTGNPRQIYVRRMDQADPKPLAGTEGAYAPFFSPDGRWIGYFARGRLNKVPVTGGASIMICASPDTAPPGGTWGADDTIIWSGGPQGGLSRVAAAGGEVQVLIAPDRKKDELLYYDPQLLPGGRAVLFSIADHTWSSGSAAVLDLTSGEKRILHKGVYGARFVPTRHIVFLREATLFAVPFDPERLQVTGTPVPVLEGVYGREKPALTFADNGTLLYIATGQPVNTTLVWVDRSGAEQALPLSPGMYESVHISPDARRVVLVVNGPASADVQVVDLDRGALNRLTFEGTNSFPLWTPDGSRVVFVSSGSPKRGLFSIPFDGSSNPAELLASNDPMRPGSWTPDGRALIVSMPGTSNRYGLWTVPVAADRSAKVKPAVLLETEFNTFSPRLSPDGRWLAYYTTQIGRAEVYVQPFPGLEGKTQISVGGGRTPVWARNGRELFYFALDGTLMAVDVETAAAFHVGTPKALFRGTYDTSSYDVSPDGKRFLMIKRAAPSDRTDHAVVVTGWFEEVKRLVSAK